MIVLKDYQERVLAVLREYMEEVRRVGNPRTPYEEIVARSGRSATYVPVQIPGLTDLPYICLRVPTGGGKTLLACHAVGVALKEFVQAECGVVLWLVPSKTILEQTAKALSDLKHPYRQALGLGVGAVEVLTIDEAVRMARATVESQTVVIVATIQCFRVEDPTGRKVYEDGNSNFREYFASLSPLAIKNLDKDPEGKPAGTLVNLLRVKRPIVIVDEAHNARTPLSFATLDRVAPSCIVEFTATPEREHNPSNVLHRVSAAELKAASMIKMPVRVVTRQQHQAKELLAEAVEFRKDLEKMAQAEGQATGEYIRPILLIQAESIAATEPLREQLVNELRLPRGQVIISTGKLDELKKIDDVAATTCPVRVIITVEKLREGWDCPFAYVLCSLKETHSATAIEQIVGRILRLPQAMRKTQPALECGYVFSVSSSVHQVLAELKEALVQSHGFTSDEAEKIVVPATDVALPLGGQPRTVQVDVQRELDKNLVAANAPALLGKVSIDTQTGAVTIYGALSEDEKEKLRVCFTTETAQKRALAAADEVAKTAAAFGGGEKPRPATGFEKQETFLVPLLSVSQDGRLLEFEKTLLLERPWKLSEKDATLSEDVYPSKRPSGETGQVDVELTGRVRIQRQDADDFVGKLHQQVWSIGSDQNWQFDDLLQWLDRTIEHRDIPAEESAEFLRKVLNGVMANRGLKDISTLVLDKYRLRDAVEKKINRQREIECKTAFDEYLLPTSALVVDAKKSVDFRKIVYEPSWWYDGVPFNKHYFPKPGELKSSGEEFECAVFLDKLDEVKYWVRNIAKRPTSFWLQTSSDRFYPDFVCLLKDGRVLVVEYKGKDRYDGIDAAEKRAVGAVWEGRSSGKCLFVMPTEKNFEQTRQKIRS